MTYSSYPAMSLHYRYIPSKFVSSYQEAKETLAASSSKDLDQESDAVAPSSAATSPRRRAGDGFVVAATQITGAGLPDSDCMGFIRRAEQAIVTAVKQHGAHLVLLPELWCGPYFCQSQEVCLMNLADPLIDNVLITHMQAYAKKYQVVLPISFYERCNNVLYNSLVVVDADGTLCNDGAPYRKSHIPDGTGYQEKFYFTPGDTGFRVFDTAVGRIGCLICWDQWSPEGARAVALQGAAVILYPTAIGSEPQDPTLDSADHWQRVMQGHAAANMVPVVASNRFGTEILCHEPGSTSSSDSEYTEKQRIHFYGRSFVTDQTGAVVAECGPLDEQNPVQVVTTIVDAQSNRKERLAWGLFRDRRPDLYGILLTKDGQEKKT